MIAPPHSSQFIPLSWRFYAYDAEKHSTESRTNMRVRLIFNRTHCCYDPIEIVVDSSEDLLSQGKKVGLIADQISGGGGVASGDDIRFLAELDLKAGKIDSLITATDIDDAFSQLDAFSAENEISLIAVYGHGGGNSLEFGLNNIKGDPGNGRYYRVMPKTWARLTNYLTDSGPLRFNGCFTGSGTRGQFNKSVASYSNWTHNVTGYPETMDYSNGTNGYWNRIRSRVGLWAGMGKTHSTRGN